MPTGARLVSAICLAALAYVLSDLIKPHMPEGTDFGYFNYVNMAVGVACGWFIMGTRAKDPQAGIITLGITGVIALVFWGLFVHGTNEMLRLAMDHRYNGPVEALLNILQIMMEYGLVMIDPLILGVMAAGALISGALVKLAGRVWR